ncbi:MAG: hypothetical protein KIT80_22380 [Chitinophagaceae bacterium]|nr:hypothetical protein [Chitinophagaceae bacterium]MCW5929683.1 hypothetical protein [Chitinophagaceae bacterium]
MANKLKLILTPKLLFVFLMVLFCRQIAGQGGHFIYIQSEDQKPFYVKAAQKKYESSGNGYLVIDDLGPVSYDLIIGFDTNPGQEWSFSCSLEKNDLAFILKIRGGSPSLVTIGHNALINGSPVKPATEKVNEQKQPVISGSLSNDPFSLMLADVVNDPSIRLKPEIIEKKKEVLVAAPVKADSSASLVSAEKPEERDSAAVAIVLKPAEPPASPAGTKQAVDIPTAGKETTAIVSAPTNKKKQQDNSSAGIPADNRSGVILEEKKDSVTAVLPPAVKKEEPVVARTASSVPNVSWDINDSSKAVESKAKTNDPAVVVKSIKEEPEPAVADNKSKEKESVATLSNVVVKDVEPDTREETRAANQPEPEGEKRPFVLNEVVKNIRKGKKKDAEETSRTSFPVSVSIKKTLQKESSNGIELIYVDETSPGVKDTIRILIPSDKP